MTVLAFVESSEYRKELARQLARQLVAEIGIEGILEGGSQAADDLLSLLSEDLDGLTRQALRDAVAHASGLGLGEITSEEAAATFDAALARVLNAARTSLVARLADLDATVTRMIGATSAEAVAASLAAEATSQALLAPIVSVLTSAAAGAVQAVEADIAAEAVAKSHEESVAGGEEPPLFDWETRQDGKECEDVFENSCKPRHGKQLTYEEWGIFGYPGDPDAPTLCAIFAKNPGASNCRCGLRPAGSAEATPVNIADAVKAGRDRALKEAA